MAKIGDILARRTDLSTFLVHLTRDGEDDDEDDDAESRLVNILKLGMVEARTAFGQACKALKAAKLPLDSQKCVCFTETPLEHTSLLLGRIEGRTCQMSSYGIAITKKQARRRGVNPIWYLDMTPGGTRVWLTKALDKLVAKNVKEKMDPTKSSLLRLTPFIEQMGTGPTYTKEFWWEREWRHVGDFSLPKRTIVLAPADRHAYLRRKVLDRSSKGKSARPAMESRADHRSPCRLRGR